MLILRALLVTILAFLLSTSLLLAGETAEVATITGRVTSDLYDWPLSFVEIVLIDPADPENETIAATTDLNGLYTVTQPISNTWKIKFDPTEFAPRSPLLPEYYNDVYTLEEATPITAEAGTLTPNINASLAGKGQITGRVTDEPTGEPRTRVLVGAYKPGVDWPEIVVETDSSGAYTLTTNEDSAYKIKFEPPKTGNYAIEFYNNRTSLAEAESVTVPADRDLRGVDVSLTLGGAIKGVMTSSWQGRLIESPEVRAYNEGGELIQIGGRHIGVDPDFEPAGHYVIPNLPPGNYQLLFMAQQHRPLQRTELINIAAGKVIPEINAQLTFSPVVYSIATSPAISNTIALGFLHDPAPILTIDGGRSWHLISPTAWLSDEVYVPYPDVTVIEERTLTLYYRPRLVPSPFVEDRLYLLDNNAQWLQSDDAGLHWEEKDFPVESLTFDSVNSDYLYGWSPRTGSPWTRYGMRSRDGGNEWWNWAKEPCPFSAGDDPPQLLAHPTVSELLYLPGVEK